MFFDLFNKEENQQIKEIEQFHCKSIEDLRSLIHMLDGHSISLGTFHAIRGVIEYLDYKERLDKLK